MMGFSAFFLKTLDSYKINTKEIIFRVMKNVHDFIIMIQN